ncbi:tetrahydrofolate synthase [Segatella salivae]|uniref:tetrahydrofolate synthase n=1 Tax=Segatella salivae TaxID=228604 RepID=UPI0028EEBAFF|nr:tetrahydrofolate synthase [Segatella salivae]
MRGLIGCYVNIPMNTSPILNVITTQCHRSYINVPMNVFATMNTLTTQLGTSCSFDSPGLARNEPTPGKRLQGDSTPSVLSFFSESMVIARYLMVNYA